MIDSESRQALKRLLDLLEDYVGNDPKSDAEVYPQYLIQYTEDMEKVASLMRSQVWLRSSIG